jgi:hypothetical protein
LSRGRRDFCGLASAGRRSRDVADIPISAHQHGDQEADEQEHGNAANAEYHVE